MKILHLDDKSYWQEAVQEDLSGTGHTVTSTADADDAIRLGQTGEYEVLIVDNKCPKEGDGARVVKALKGRVRKVIEFSNFGGSVEGCDVHLDKGLYDRLDLIKAIEDP